MYKNMLIVFVIWRLLKQAEVETIESSETTDKTKVANVFAGGYFLARNYQCTNRANQLESTKVGTL